MKPTPGRKRRRFTTVLAALLMFLGMATVIAPSASAEEDCTAYFFGGDADAPFLPCPHSRTTGYMAGYAFMDNNTDSAPTSLHLADCSSNPDIDLMFYEPSGVEQGWHKIEPTQRFWCLNTDGGWRSWGRQTRVGLYAFVVANHRGTGPLSGWLHGGW